MKKMLKLSDMMELLQKSRPGVFAAVEAGEVPPPAKIGRHYRWSAEIIDAWVAAGMPKQKPS